MKMKVMPQDRFPTPSGKIEFYSQLAERDGLPPLPGYYEESKDGYPFQLITANEMHLTRSQFHNVWAEEVEPIVLLNEEDARAKGIKDGSGNSFKEFLGINRLEILDTLFLTGMTMIGQDDAGVSDAQLRSGGEGFPGGLRDREVGCERHNFIEASREKLPTLMKRLS